MARAIDVVQVKAEIAAEKLAVIIENGSVLLKDMQSGEAVKIATLTPPNEPLTCEELREMDGEPVYSGKYKRWFLVKHFEALGRSQLIDGTGTPFIDKECFPLYRRPPEGESDA